MKLVMMTAAALALTTGGVALAEDKADKQIKKIIIVERNGSKREIDIAKVQALAAEHCGDPGQRFESEASVPEQDRKTKLVVCADGAGDRLAALEKARARLAESENFGVDPRTRALAALDAEIARLKAAN